MLADLHLAPLPQDTVREFIGQGIERLVQRCLGAAGGGAAQEPRAHERFMRHYAQCNGAAAKPYPGVLEGLGRMRGAGLRLACVTNKAERFTRSLLERAALAQYLDAVVTADQVGIRKPQPEPFLEACRRLGVSPGEAAVVGDSENDARGARAAGCCVVLVPYGYSEGRDVRAIESDGIVATLSQAADLFIESS